jgi:hypothetical protein
MSSLLPDTEKIGNTAGSVIRLIMGGITPL